MAKLRKMLGDIYSPECTALMRLIETQSKNTLAAWAAAYAREKYLPIYKKAFPDDARLDEALDGCDAYLAGGLKLTELKPLLKRARELASGVKDPAAQAAARAVAVACATVSTPTNSFGFLLYGAAAAAYDEVGFDKTAQEYDAIASRELNAALESLKSVAVSDEPNPAKIDWNC
jgi:hypothetical protein